MPPEPAGGADRVARPGKEAVRRRLWRTQPPRSSVDEPIWFERRGIAHPQGALSPPFLSVPGLSVRTDVRRSGEADSVTVNLQVEYFIRKGGGSIVRDFESAVALLQKLVSVNA